VNFTCVREIKGRAAALTQISLVSYLLSALLTSRKFIMCTNIRSMPLMPQFLALACFAYSPEKHKCHK